MGIQIIISAIPVSGGGFLPHAYFHTLEGNIVTNHGVHFSKEGIVSSKEKALENAEIGARQQIMNEYGNKVNISIKIRD